MFLKDVKRDMLVPDKEIFINKSVKIRAVDVLLISITSEGHRNVLWTLCRYSPRSADEMAADETEAPGTNRYEKTNALRRSYASRHLPIAEITIQAQKMTFSSSQSSPLYENDYQGYMKLQHFIENGLDTTDWDEFNLADIVITAHRQEDAGEFPQIDPGKELDITVKVNKEFRELPINQPMLLSFGEAQKGVRYSFYDRIHKKDRFFYLDKLEHYDVWEEVKSHFKNDSPHGLGEEQRTQLEEQYTAHLASVCPKGMDVAMLTYETEDDVQLNFYTTAHLDARPVHNSSFAVSFMFFTSDGKPGNNGFKSRSYMISPIEKTFYGNISIELFSWYLELPEEVIRI